MLAMFTSEPRSPSDRRLLQHLHERVLADQERALQVDVEHAVPRLGVEEVHRAAAGDTGRVHDARRAGRASRAISATSAATAASSRTSSFAEPRGRRPSAPRLQVRADHLRALGREALHAGQPDARRRARHQRDLSRRVVPRIALLRCGNPCTSIATGVRPMKFALFYEIPVAAPVGRRAASTAPTRTRSSRRCSREQCGWDAFWTVEHHFLEEYSHCSNPEVLYGAIAARTEPHAARLRRAAHAQAVQPSGAHGRVGRGARPALRRPRRLRHRPLVHARRARGLRHRSARDARDVAGGDRARRRLLDERRVRVRAASTGRCRSAACCPKPLQQPHPPIWGATSREDGHAQIGELGLGLCSFAVGAAARAR